MKLDVKFVSENQIIDSKFLQINNISDGGYERGYAEGETDGYSKGYTEGETKGFESGKSEGIEEGYSEGKADGITEGIEQGKQAEYDAFWDSFQQEGARTDYQRAFYGAWWNDENFKPKYDIKPSGNAAEMFNNSGITDLKSICERQGITLDFSQVTYSSNTFHKSKVTRIPVLDVRNIANCSSLFNSANNLVWVDGVKLNENGGQAFGASVSSNWVLYSMIAHLPILSGVINTNCWMPLPALDKESIESFFAALSDTTSGLSMTFSKKAKEAAFTEEEWAMLVATKPNWTISLI